MEKTVSSSRVGQRSIDRGVIACDVASASVATGHPQVDLHLYGEYETSSKRSWTTWRDICSCCGLESVRCQGRMRRFWMSRRLPNGSNYLARLDIKRRVCGFVVGHYRSTRRFNKNPWMCFSRWVALVHFVSSDVVVWSPSAAQVGMLSVFRICCCSFH